LYSVTLFEKEPELGGHARTIDVSVGNKTFPVDVGFMVFNPPQYPNFTHVLNLLGVETRKTNMSFSVSVDDGAVEFSGAFPFGIFADWKNMFRPRFLFFLMDIFRFNAVARRALREDTIGDDAVGVFLDRHGFKTFFRHHYLYPMAGSIWSGSFGNIAEFPAQMLFEFLEQHHLLEVRNKPAWHAIVGGSREYVRRVVDDIAHAGGVLQTSAAVSGVSRHQNGCTVTVNGDDQDFDFCILATHADTSLALLRDPDGLEAEVLKPFRYSDNHIVVHSDPSNMPRRAAAWASWNFCCPSNGRAEHVYLTYRINSLQHIDPAYPVFITLNPTKHIDSALVHLRFSTTHPIFTNETKHAQAKLNSIQGARHTYYCGAWTRYGFHEDGLVSAIKVAELLGASVPWK